MIETVPLDTPLVADAGEVERLARFMHEETLEYFRLNVPYDGVRCSFDGHTQEIRERYRYVARAILERFPRG